VAKTEDILRELAGEHDGFFTTLEAGAAGVPSVIVAQLHKRGRVKRVAQGLYRFPRWPTSEFQQYQEAVLWPQVYRRLDYSLISHDSALEFYNLTQLNPSVIHVTLPEHTRIRRAAPSWIRLHFVAVSESDRRWEHRVSVVGIPRAIEDVAETRGLNVVHQAVSEARERRLLREDELARLVTRFGPSLLEPHHATAS
jgi:predicted transcriptional regulator of viral defense system